MDFFTSTWFLAGILIIDLCIRVAAIIVIPRNRRPTSAMAWLLAIFFIPFIGVLLFLLIGNPRLPRARRRKQQRINGYIAEARDRVSPDTIDENHEPWFRSIVGMNRTLGALPLTEGNDVQIIADYAESLASMAFEIRGAQHFVHVEFYILQSDEATEGIFSALEDAARRGVRVRVLLDHWANLGKPRYRATVRRLNAMGIEWHHMLPVQPLRGKWQRPDLRNHRKLLVVDGTVAFTGSQNLTHASYNLRKNIKRGLLWVDVMVRVTGPVVASVNAVFLSDWYSETDEILMDWEGMLPLEPGTGDLECQVVPSGPGYSTENNLWLFLTLLYAAQRHIRIISPYFVPDEALLTAIMSARARGVEIELFVSEEGDQAIVYHAQRSYYEMLLKAGVRIWMYRKPFILHTKSLAVDDEVAVIGSSNMDMRSFGLNLEISMLVRGRDFVDALRIVEAQYRELSRELSLEEWMQQPLRSRILDNLARLTSALQ